MASRPKPDTSDAEKKAAEKAKKKAAREAKEREDRRRDARVVASKKEELTEARVDDAAEARGIEKNAAPEVNIEFEMPDLSGIEVRVPAASAVTEGDVDAKIAQLRHQVARGQPVAFGARVERGDQVELDVMGYHEEALFLTMVREWMIVDDNPQLPGFFDEVEGMFVGEEKAFKVTLGEQYVDEALRGQPVAFAVKVHNARRPELPALDDDFWSMLGMGKESVARDAIRGELVRERADALVERAKEMVLDRILHMVDAAIDDEAVNHALNELWRHQQGDQLMAKNASLESQSEARGGFTQDETMREQVRRSFFERALLDKVMREQNIETSENDILNFVLELVNGTALSTNRVHEALTGQLGWDGAMHARLRDMRAMEWIFAQVKVTFASS